MNEEQKNSAVILQFPRRRGRPRKALPQRDSGTEELQAKRAQKITTEALDLCLEKSLITPQQHWCGIHLRWLHTLRYGAPSVRALDPTHLGGRETAQTDTQWRANRENEYHEAVLLLRKHRLAEIVGSVCIYDQRPDFLTTQKTPTHSQRKMLAQLVEGLSLLDRVWSRPKS